MKQGKKVPLFTNQLDNRPNANSVVLQGADALFLCLPERLSHGFITGGYLDRKRVTQTGKRSR